MSFTSEPQDRTPSLGGRFGDEFLSTRKREADLLSFRHISQFVGENARYPAGIPTVNDEFFAEIITSDTRPGLEASLTPYTDARYWIKRMTTAESMRRVDGLYETFNLPTFELDAAIDEGEQILTAFNLQELVSGRHDIETGQVVRVYRMDIMKDSAFTIWWFNHLCAVVDVVWDSDNAQLLKYRSCHAGAEIILTGSTCPTPGAVPGISLEYYGSL